MPSGVASASSETADRLREARALFAQTGGRVAGIPAELPDPAAFEALLACAGHDSAAMALLGRDTGFILSRGGNGVCLATIATGGGSEDVTAEGATTALALLAAQVAAILAETGAVTDAAAASAGAVARPH